MDFIDPLQWNLFSLMGIIGTRKKGIGVRYSLKRYRPLLSLEYQFKDDPLISIKDKKDKHINDIKTLESERLYDLVKEILSEGKMFPTFIL